ncbi:hypothetical protein ACPPVV_06060 [Rhodanobacter sp. Col0626]|uniref:hypothetical protein n=1 Tax=Rhodanobacter sp. Col0626 TaxID=3415679 RepID=UPI003CE90164
MCASPCLLLLALSTQAASALPAGIVKADWPAPVAKFVERSASCMHFAGEFNGDGSARDAEVNRRMDKLRCNALHQDLQALRRRYRTDARVTARLGAFDEDGMPKDADTGI